MKQPKLIPFFFCLLFISKFSFAFINVNHSNTESTHNNPCPAPVISAFSPTSGPENTLITINGSNFNNAVDVSFNGVTAAFTIINDNQITAYAASALNTSATISISSSGGCVGNSTTDFAFIQPSCTDTGDIYISEIYDAFSGSYAVIELYNPTSTPIVLDGVYVIDRYGDIGNPTPSHTYAMLGTIAPLDTFIILLGGGSDCPTLVADFTVGTGINDNDEFKLLKNGTVIDVVEAPNERGYSIIRNPDAVVPNNTFVPSDWVTDLNETCSDLGSHTADPITTTTIPVITQPDWQTICENGNALFTVSVATGTYTYQWKILNNSGVWVNVVDNATYSGATTNTLSLNNVPISFDNNQYYCEITSTTCNLVTDTTHLIINNITTAPSVECWENASFNNATCAWEITGTQPAQPSLECWENASFNNTTCTWEITGSQDPMPTGLECWEIATFNTTTCTWEVNGTQPIQPSLECWENASFNNATCTWEITGTQDPMPTGLECWEIATFNTTTCTWEVNGTQPIQPSLECWENATFNTTTCAWEISGTQPIQPSLECWEIATFNNAACTWEVTGTQNPMPTGLECWEITTFNNATCTWEISGTQPIQPSLACWENAVFNNTSCIWEITGTQPTQPSLECWEIATFNNTTCTWEISGTFIDFDLTLSNITIVDNTITVNMTDSSISYEYAIDNGSFQSSPVFFGLSNGTHTLYVQDINGCVLKSIQFEIETAVSIHIPLFFTPNNDGENDVWQITDTQNTIKEIYVYDRYGKLLKQIPLQSKSWDGLYRGYPKESNDYWYVITLRTGEQLNGHFTLKR